MQAVLRFYSYLGDIATSPYHGFAYRRKQLRRPVASLREAHLQIFGNASAWGLTEGRPISIFLREDPDLYFAFPTAWRIAEAISGGRKLPDDR